MKATVDHRKDAKAVIRDWVNGWRWDGGWDGMPSFGRVRSKKGIEGAMKRLMVQTIEVLVEEVDVSLGNGNVAIYLAWADYTEPLSLSIEVPLASLIEEFADSTIENDTLEEKDIALAQLRALRDEIDKATSRIEASR